MKEKELRGILESKGLDLAIFYSLGMEPNPNVVYLSQYYGSGMVILPRKGNPLLIVPKMEYERAKTSNIKSVYAMDRKRFFESAREITRKRGIRGRKIGIDGSAFTINAYKSFRKSFRGAKPKDISLDLLKLRETKTQKEIAILKKSCNYASKILEKTIKNFRDFRTESEAAAFLEYEAKKLGLQLSFPPIVASGRNGSMPHYEPKNIKLNKGFCVLDYGVKYKGYCSDITRTIYLGKPNKKEKEVYNLLLNVQTDIIKNIKLNDKCSKIFEKCVDGLGQYSKYFIHGLGHGIGTQIHELPNLNSGSKDVMQKNSVFTIEPGIYLPKKFGIRIEDSILMAKKPILLTKVKKDLIVV